MSKGSKEKRMSLKTAMRDYEHTERDKREDRRGAKELMRAAGKSKGKAHGSRVR